MMRTLSGVKSCSRIFAIIVCTYLFKSIIISAKDGRIEIVSIIDRNSTLQAFTKIHSIIESTAVPDLLHFRVLSMTTAIHFEISALFAKCFSTVSFESKVWQRPKTLPKLSGKRFEKEHIFARFYLPEIFPDVMRFLYLDNDIIVTMDIQEVFNYSLEMRELGSFKLLENSTTSAIAAFCFEYHPQYRAYVRHNFNLSHPLVNSTLSLRPTGFFLNAGVFTVDAHRWRMEKYTRKAEEIIRMNNEMYIYSNFIGDQGTFFLLLQDRIAYLPALFNLRRSPKRTILSLSDGTKKGVIHLAGTLSGGSERLCVEPFQYHAFRFAVLPLYLVIRRSLTHMCPAVASNESTRLCENAFALLNTTESRSLNIIKYNPGRNKNFSWV